MWNFHPSGKVVILLQHRIILKLVGIFTLLFLLSCSSPPASSFRNIHLARKHATLGQTFRPTYQKARWPGSSSAESLLKVFSPRSKRPELTAAVGRLADLPHRRASRAAVGWRDIASTEETWNLRPEFGAWGSECPGTPSQAIVGEIFK